MSWVEVGCVSGLRPLVVGLWWLGCWGGGHWRGWGGFGCSVLWWVQIGVEVQIGVAGVVGFVAVLWRFCGRFWLQFVLCFFFFGGYRLRLWLVVVAVAVAVAVVTSDELEKFRLWRF